jgi:hypothetical protein
MVPVEPGSLRISADLNSDGKDDLVVAPYNRTDPSKNTYVSVLLGNGDGTFQAKQDFPVGSSPLSATSADFNADGITDLATANRDSDNVSVLLGQDSDGDGKGEGTFKPKQDFAAGDAPNSVISAQFNDDNADGKVDSADSVDLAIANYNSKNLSVLLSNGDGTFQEKKDFFVGLLQNTITSADFNADGYADLAISGGGPALCFSSDPCVGLSVLLADNYGNFQYPTEMWGGWATSVTSADINQDNMADLVATFDTSCTGCTPLASVRLGYGDGTFQDRQDFAAGDRYPRSAITPDFNGDTYPDLALGADGNNVPVLLNTAPPKEDTTPPTVDSVSPEDAATGVALNTPVEATFSEAIDQRTLSSTTFTLTKQGGTTRVSATLSYDTATKKATLVPKCDLAPNTTYSATITTGVKDGAVNALEEDYNWAFTTTGGERAWCADDFKLDQQQTSSNDRVSIDDIGYSQEVTAGVSGVAKQVSLYIGCCSDGSSPEGGVSIFVGDSMWGADGYGYMSQYQTKRDGSLSWVDVPLLDPAPVVEAGESFYIWVYPDNSADAYSWGVTTPDAYPGGDLFSMGSGENAGYDAAFRTYVTASDGSPPETTIDSGPSGTVEPSDATFEFSSSESNSTFKCKILKNGATYWDWSTCTPGSFGFYDEGSYTFEVKASDATASTDPTPESRTWTVAVPPPLSPPTITSPADNSYNTDGNITFSGTAEQGSTVKVYQDGATTAAGQATASTSDGSWTINLTGVSEQSTAHTFDVTATDAATSKESAKSTVHVTVDTTAPPAPVITSPTNGSSTDSTIVSGTESEDGTQVTLYQVKSDGSTVQLGDPVTVSSGKWSIDTKLTTAGSYTIQATASDKAGNKTNSSRATFTFSTTPAAPSGLTATQTGTTSSQYIKLTWKDNSNSEKNFVLERSTDQKNWTVLSSTLAPNTTSYTDTKNLSKRTKYYYRVKATNDAGSSAYSNVASATTK